MASTDQLPELEVVSIAGLWGQECSSGLARAFLQLGHALRGLWGVGSWGDGLQEGGQLGRSLGRQEGGKLGRQTVRQKVRC